MTGFSRFSFITKRNLLEYQSSYWEELSTLKRSCVYNLFILGNSKKKFISLPAKFNGYTKTQIILKILLIVLIDHSWYALGVKITFKQSW